MSNLLEIAYEKFLDEYDTNYSSQIANETTESMDRELAILEQLMGEEMLEAANDLIIEGLEDVQKAGFFAGFAYCTKLMTAEKIDFLAVS